MLSEYLNDSGAAVWTQVMPGARACVFSLGEGPASLPLRLEALVTRQPFLQSENAPMAAASSSIITCHRRVILASQFCQPPAFA